MARNREKNSAAMTSEELSVFCDQIALMLESGMTLRDGVDMLAEDEEKSGAKARPYTRLRPTVEETGSLYVAMKEQEEDWPHYMVEMVGIGEETGRLEEIMRNLSAYYLREDRIRDAASSAVTYPLVLGVMMVVIIGVLLWRVMPVFRRVLGSLGVDPNGSSVRLMNIGAAAGWVVLALVGALILCAVTVGILLRTKKREKTLRFLKKLLPPVRRIGEKLSASRIAGMLGMMLGSGFPIDSALDMAANALDDEGSVEKAKEIRKKMDAGEPFADAMEESGLFSDFYNRVLKIGAASGNEPQVLTKISEVYEEQVEDDLSRLISLIEPVMVALLSIVIGAILLSMMLPMAGVMSSL